MGDWFPGWLKEAAIQVCSFMFSTPLRVLDLFSGCGGLSLGFHLAGFRILGGVEANPHAAESHGANFHPDEPTHALARDITKTDPAILLSEFGLTGPVDEQVDVVVGGPPCQAYARIGRAKLREIADHPEAYTRDLRGDLFRDYLRFVAVLRPAAVVMENVPDILKYGGQNVAEVIADALDALGYEVSYRLLNAAAFGVPQTRERMILIGWRRELGLGVPDFPVPTRSLRDLPIGYRGTRSVARKLEERIKAGETGLHYRPRPSGPGCRLPDPVTVRQAIGDLPSITGHLDGRIKRGPRRFRTLQRYTLLPTSHYASTMRKWEGVGEVGGVKDHVIRWLPRDYPIFARMKHGDQYPEAFALANRMLKERIRQEEKHLGRPLSVEEEGALRKKIVPPYDPGKFPNKWRKLEPDKPSRTLLAHLGKDSYTHIHYDSVQRRTISVREAARLQSFPDRFVFKGSMNPAFKMIGNAVPPLLAKAVADHLRKRLYGA